MQKCRGTEPRVTASAGRGAARAGFTLIEVMMAAAVMVIAISGSLVLLNQSFRMIDGARNSGLAAQIMQSEIERLRLKSWTDLTTTVPSSGTVDVAGIFNNDASITNRFTVTRTVTGVSGREDTMKEIKIEVRWRNLDGVESVRTFSTFYSKNGLYDFYYTVAKSS